MIALRGHAISFRDDPFLSDDALVDIEDALVVAQDGVITAAGPYEQTRGAVPAGVEPTRHGGLLCAGFIDAHVHYVQSEVAGTAGSQLIDWLDHRAYPEERRFADGGHAARVASLFLDELLANGTTTALTFCATYPQSVDAFFEEAARRGMRMIAGKVLMDRNAPQPLLDTATTAYEQSRRLIATWHGRGRSLYAITPRFAPTSTPEQLELAGALWRESPGTYVHTHVAESLEEVAWVRSLFPARRDYLDVYDHHGLLGPRAVLAHGIHLGERERERVHEAGAALAHCPTSNLALGSGLFDLGVAKDPRRPLRVGLGTDVGAGTSLSLLRTMADAHKVAALRGQPLSAAGSFYLATLGGAEALGLGETIGSIAVGKEADLVVLDPTATALLAARSARAETTEELLLALATLGDDRAVAAVYVGGRLAYSRLSA